MLSRTERCTSRPQSIAMLISKRGFSGRAFDNRLFQRGKADSNPFSIAQQYHPLPLPKCALGADQGGEILFFTNYADFGDGPRCLM